MVYINLWIWNQCIYMSYKSIVIYSFKIDELKRLKALAKCITKYTPIMEKEIVFPNKCVFPDIKLCEFKVQKNALDRQIYIL